MGDAKKTMPFVQGLKKRLLAGESPEIVLELKLPFDEMETLLQMVPTLIRSAGLAECNVLMVRNGMGVNFADDSKQHVSSPIAKNAVPGVPPFFFENFDV
jgi:leucyl-tRNA synthetase